jgi:hypothetical protein
LKKSGLVGMKPGEILKKVTLPVNFRSRRS